MILSLAAPLLLRRLESTRWANKSSQMAFRISMRPSVVRVEVSKVGTRFWLKSVGSEIFLGEEGV